jgi:hypothetical protein
MIHGDIESETGVPGGGILPGESVMTEEKTGNVREIANCVESLKVMITMDKIRFFNDLLQSRENGYSLSTKFTG